MIEPMTFLMGEHVERLSNNAKGIVHHAVQFPGEPWKYLINFENGDSEVLSAEEFRLSDD